MVDAEQFNAEMGDAQESSGAQSASDMELFEQYLDQELDLDLPGRGDLREGVIVEIRPSELLVNVGSKRDGVVPQSDLARLDPEFVKNLHEGQTVDVVIARQPDDDGIFVLSMADALQQRDWITAQNLMDSGEITTHRVVGYNKGGLTVEFNHLRGFVPASHIVDMPRNLSEDQRRAELEGRIGQKMRLKVIEVERRRRRLVMSESLAEREYQAARREELFKTLTVGDVITGEVRSLRPFGAFVDIGGSDGLLHVSEIGWSNINHPREALEVGQTIDVQVIRIDTDNQRIGLSRKRLLPNPWDTVEERYHSGDVLPATITRVVDFGAFAELEPGIEGLIHISELADIEIAEPLKTVRVGDKVQVKVLRVDRKRQRVGLSLRQAEPLDVGDEFTADGEAEIGAEGEAEMDAEAAVELEAEAEAEVDAAIEPELETMAEAEDELEDEEEAAAQFDADSEAAAELDTAELDTDDTMDDGSDDSTDDTSDDSGIEVSTQDTPEDSLEEEAEEAEAKADEQ
jgi:small subunit ribosomal protein S1